MIATAPHLRFREARERLGLSPDEVASRSGISSASIWDIEQFEHDLTACYSPRDLQRFCRILGIRPVELVADSIAEPPISANGLVQRVQTECRSRGVTMEQFENTVGWRLSACIEPPQKLLEDMTVDGLQWLCRELHIDWRRVLLGL